MDSCRYAIFPFGQVKSGSRVVIYGAGRAGQNFYHQVRASSYCSIQYLVDKNHVNIPFHGAAIKPIEALVDSSAYDYCVISILDKAVRLSILEDLLTLGVPEQKIVLPNDNEFDWAWYGFPSAPKEFEFAASFDNYFRHCDARDFVSSQRIDITVRYLLFKDFINGVDNKENLSLFSRFTLARNNGTELIYFHSSGEGKQGIKDFIDQGKALCESIKQTGFHKEQYIPINEKGEALDGLHRISASIVTGEPIWAREYPNSKQLHLDFSFFEKQGFSVEDKIRVLRAFSDIYHGQLSIAVLFAPIYEHWDYAERQLAKVATVVGDIILDFEGNYIAYENIMHEMYDDALFVDQRIERKLHALMMSQLKMKVVLLSDEGFKENEIPFHKRLSSVKFGIREALKFDVNEVPIHLHLPDDDEEFLRLKHILLSVNGLKCARRKFAQRYTQHFIRMLNEFKNWCAQNHIPITDTCIVGSASMGVFGIKEIDDIDFTLLPEYRSKFNNDEMHKISDTLEMVRKDYVRSVDGSIITDVAVIGDDNLHFWFYGCKFLNLEELYKKKKYNNRPKDIEDLRRLDLFFDLEFAYDGKAALRKQVEEEMFRRRFCL